MTEYTHVEVHVVLDRHTTRMFIKENRLPFRKLSSQIEIPRIALLLGPESSFRPNDISQTSNMNA